MIVVQLRGGLGNQMFQYAFGKCLATKNNTSLSLDTSFLQSKLPFKKWATQMQYELHIFDVQADLKKNLFTSNLFLYPIAKTEHLIRTKLIERKFSLLTETDFGCSAEFLTAGDNRYLIGNFQSEQYFKEIESQIRKDFTFKASLNTTNSQWAENIKNCNSVSIHIRRGDYISINRNAKKFAAIPIKYYSDAVEIMAKKISQPVFFLFSDDIKWAKENIQVDYPVHFVQNNTNSAGDDMRLMSYCKHNIICNSTFSWWSAWLNGNPHKIVIAPLKWFEDSSINSKDIYPSEWIKL
jgi:hypothetical protein